MDFDVEPNQGLEDRLFPGGSTIAGTAMHCRASLDGMLAVRSLATNTLQLFVRTALLGRMTDESTQIGEPAKTAYHGRYREPIQNSTPASQRTGVEKCPDISKFSRPRTAN